MAEPIKVPLRDPLTTHDGTLTELVLRVPTFRVLRRFGEPLVSSISRNEAGDTSVTVTRNMAAFGNIIADLSGLDEGVLDGLSAHDAMRAVEALTPYFARV